MQREGLTLKVLRAESKAIALTAHLPLLLNESHQNFTG